MSLREHAIVLRCLADALRGEGENGTDRPATSEVLCLMAEAHLHAADRLEQIDRDQVVGHACTIDHRALSAAKCPACGAPRG